MGDPEGADGEGDGPTVGGWSEEDHDGGVDGGVGFGATVSSVGVRGGGAFLGGPSGFMVLEDGGEGIEIEVHGEVGLLGMARMAKVDCRAASPNEPASG